MERGGVLGKPGSLGDPLGALGNVRLEGGVGESHSLLGLGDCNISHYFPKKAASGL